MLRNSIRNSIRSFKSADGGLPPFSFGNALKFDGVNDFVQSNNNIGFSGSQPRSISFWFKTTLNALQSICQIQQSSAGYYVQIPNKDALSISVAGGTSSAASLDFSINNGNWNHFLIVQESTNIGSVKMYLNGVSQSMSYSNPTFSINTLNLPLRIGYRFSNTFPMNGVLDEFAIWDVALSSDDAIDLYNNGNGDYATKFSPNNLKLYYRLNETAPDNTALDASGNGNTGTLNNFDTATCWVAH